MGASAGKPSYAIANGSVFLTGDEDNAGFGKYVVIRHEIPTASGTTPDVYFSIYAHLQSDSALSAGDKVRAGDYIGPIGDTGTDASTGPHLHLEVVRINDAEVTDYVNNRNDDGLWGYRETTNPDSDSAVRAPLRRPRHACRR